MQQSKALGRLAMIGAELVLTCFLPTELIRSCMNMYCGKVLVKKALPKPDTKLKTFELLNLPPEIREVIYNKVTNLDIKSLRQICRQIMEEIDFMFGVEGILNERCAGNLEWIQRVKLRGLRVINLYTPITNTSVVAIPKTAKTIHVFPSTLSPSNLKAILKGTKTVRELTLQLNCGPESGPILPDLLMAKSREFSDIILDAIRLNYHLIDMSITMSPYSSGFDFWDSDFWNYWDEEYHTDQQIQDCQGYSRTLKSIRITAPFMSRESCNQWKLLFDQQTRLECVRCTMGPVHWSFYSKMLQNCYRTLKVIVLQEVQSFDPEFPFDWSILSQCPCLEVLHIMDKFKPHDEIHAHERFESINFSSVNMANLRELTLAHVSLYEFEFEKILKTARKLEILNVLFVRHEMDFYPIFSTLIQVLKKSNTIQTMIFADSTGLFAQGNNLGVWIQQAFNAVMWTKHKYLLCKCEISSGLNSTIFPGIKIDRLT